MDFNPGQKNTNGNAPSTAPRFPAGGGGMNMGGDGNKKMVITAAVVVVVLLLAVLGWWMWGKMGSSESQIMADRYQALFLTNGQVYFCKLTDVDAKYVKCHDIYYLQVQQAVQPADNKNNNQQPQVSLAKLGSELHGPEDVMYVNRDQVLFWENLKNDGKVVQAIQNNQKK
jgi:4-amino-4-deoxy-L-arabinose transferase-like glycosyltransferase